VLQPIQGTSHHLGFDPINSEDENKMTKAELVSKIAVKGEITKSQAEKAVDGFVSAVSAALSGGDKITLVGFGTFSVGSRSQRAGRNPRTGEKIKVPVSNVVKFKAGRILSHRLGRNEQNTRDLEILNRRAEFLNQEANDVLEYQAPL